MKKYAILIITAVFFLQAETLFQVKDSQDRVVLDVSTDGLRVYNEGDLLMEISSSDIRAFIEDNPAKGLARSFSVTTSTNLKAQANVLEVTTKDTKMREGNLGEKYTDFSPQNMFLGLNAGSSIGGAKYNVFIGNYSGNTTTGPEEPDMYDFGYYNTFIGYESGKDATNSFNNTYIGALSGKENLDGSDNTFVGSDTGVRNTGHANTFVGSFSAGHLSGSGHANAFFGTRSGSYNTTGAKNVFVGGWAGASNRTGNDNVYVGQRAGGSNTSGSGNVFLGHNAGANETGSNRLYIANSDTATPLIKGTFPNTDLTFTANRVNVVHPMGEGANGLSINNTYNGNTTTWRFYQMIDNRLGLYYNTSYRGSWDTTSGAYSQTSDIRLKENIEKLNSVTEKVMKLHPQRYNFKDQKELERRYIGLIAQDVEKIFPEFVYFSQENDTYTIDYSGLSVVAIQAIKEQQTKIDDQEKRIAKLEGMIEKMLDK